MIVDVNVLLHAIDGRSPHHAAVSTWLAEALTGSRRIGLPWQTIGGFLRISTHPRAFDRPLSPVQAWEALDGWLASPVAWIPPAGPRTVEVLRQLTREPGSAGTRTSDAELAALALEHGVPVVSTNADFQQFPGLVWVDPRS